MAQERLSEQWWPWEEEQCARCGKPSGEEHGGELAIRPCGRVEHAGCHDAHVQEDYAW